jgi:hypothetical protein
VAERHSTFAREAEDWYVEPAVCFTRLLERVPQLRTYGLHDPCAGLGTIPLAARKAGLVATGADLVDRAAGLWVRQDYFTDHRMHDNIVTNPPFNIAAAIIAHALDHTRFRVCAIAQAKFLFSQRRHALFDRVTMERVIVFSRRPSMPTGTMLVERGEACRGGGSLDFCWVVWNVQKVVAGCAVDWVL